MIKATDKTDALVQLIGSLADPTRLRLLRLLERHELGVVELCEILQLPQSTVSRHLKVLMDLKWARSRKHGTAHLYRVSLEELEPASRKLWLLAREQTEHWATVQQDALRLNRRLEERERNSRDFFASAAGQWDRLRGELYGRRFQTDVLLALLPSEYVVADLACGTGQMALDLAPHVKRVIGVDNSPEMLDAAGQRLEKQGNVELRAGELERLPITDQECDAALLLLALTYVMDPSRALAETSRILKPGGRVVIVDLLPHDRDAFRREMKQCWMGFDQAQIRPWLAEAGFSRCAVHSLPPEPQAKGPALFLAVGVRSDL